MAEKPRHVFEIYIRTTPERLWQALTDGELTQQYYFGSSVEGEWAPGSGYRYSTPNGGTLLDGEVLEADPPRRLVTTFRALWSPDVQQLPLSRVTWEIEPVGTACRLTLVHEELDTTGAGQGIVSGWAQILSSMKTLLETGEPLVLDA